ncbi:MAG: hypothetical protein KDE54_13210 [Caldilineaceae bacterium]|nr:hypothetical protein [Caldilineaceae bacterium]MCB0094528.1 hypothetical protein [Caldilineaceae bacterium]
MQNPSVIQHELHSALSYQPTFPVIAIYGSSLFMTIIEISLQKESNLQVFRLDPTCPHTPERMVHLHPAAIITESFYEDQLGPLLACITADSTDESNQWLCHIMQDRTENQLNQTQIIYFEHSSNFQMIRLNHQYIAINRIQDLIDIVLRIEPSLCGCNEN